MNKNFREEIERIKSELANNQCIISRNNQRLESDPWLQKQILFWTESTRFLLSELEIWEQAENHPRCDETTLKAQKALDTLYNLLRQLD